MKLPGKITIPFLAAAAMVCVAGGVVHAQGELLPGGVLNDDQTSVIYNANTGAVGVDAPIINDVATGLTSININSRDMIFSGDPADAENLGGDFDIFTEDTIFKATFGSDFGSLSFGQVAPVGLSEAAILGDFFQVDGALVSGGGLGEVDLVYIPEPASAILLSIGLIGLIGLRRRR